MGTDMHSLLFQLAIVCSILARTNFRFERTSRSIESDLFAGENSRSPIDPLLSEERLLVRSKPQPMVRGDATRIPRERSFASDRSIHRE